MEIARSYTFNATASKVWDLLIDPDVVAQCLPGCEKLEPLGEDRYEATLTIEVAGISGMYQGTIRIAAKRPPSSYRLLIDGSGKPGFIKGEGGIVLTEEGDKTRVDVKGGVQVGGLVARVGQRLLGGVSKMMMDRFFNCLQQKATEL